MQGIPVFEPRTVTPEVAGSSPVAPVVVLLLFVVLFLEDLVGAADLAGPCWNRPFVAGPGNGAGQRLAVAGHLQALGVVVRMPLVP